MLREFTRKDETNGGLNFARRDGTLLTIRSKFGSLASDTLEYVIHKRVKDGHSLIGDTRVRMHLLENFVDVRRIRLFPHLLALLLLTFHGRCGLLSNRGFLRFSGSYVNRSMDRKSRPEPLTDFWRQVLCLHRKRVFCLLLLCHQPLLMR